MRYGHFAGRNSYPGTRVPGNPGMAFKVAPTLPHGELYPVCLSEPNKDFLHSFKTFKTSQTVGEYPKLKRKLQYLPLRLAIAPWYMYPAQAPLNLQIHLADAKNFLVRLAGYRVHVPGRE
eukprot:1713231-Rhodomonas_salina.1